MNITIGKKIRQLREELKITQASLAEPEMTKSMISHIENGYAYPSMKNLQYIAKKLNKPVTYFLEDDAPLKNQCSSEDDLPMEIILDTLKSIDNLIEKEMFEQAKQALHSLLESYSFNEASKLFADIIFRIGLCCIKLRKYDEGEKYLENCSSIYTDNQMYLDAAKAYMNLSLKPLFQYNYTQSLSILDRAWEIYDKSTSKDVFLEIKLLINRPAIYFAMGEFNKAISICEKIISLSNDNKIYYMIDNAYRIMAIIFLLQDEYDSFIINADKALKFSEFTNNKLGLIKLYHNYAKYHNIMNNPLESLKYLELLQNTAGEKTFYYYLEHAKSNYILQNYDASLKDLSDIDYTKKANYLTDDIYLLSGKIYKGLIHGKLNNYDEAIFEIEDAIKGIEGFTKSEYAGVTKYAYKELSFATESLSEIYFMKQDYPTAYSLLKKSNQLKDLSRQL